MKYYAASGALIGTGSALIVIGVVIWRAVNSFAERGEAYLLYPVKDGSGRVF